MSDTEHLEAEVKALREELNAVQQHLDEMETREQTAYEKAFDVGDWALENEERIDGLEETQEEMQDTDEQIEYLAIAAFRVVREMHQQHGAETKVEIATRTARNELLRRASQQNIGSRNIPLSRTRVIEMAHPEHDLSHQTVKRAFATLEADYDCFYTTTSNGLKSLSVRVTEIPDEVVILVAADTGRTDIAESLLGTDSAAVLKSALTNTSISGTSVGGVQT